MEMSFKEDAGTTGDLDFDRLRYSSCKIHVFFLCMLPMASKAVIYFDNVLQEWS